MNEKISVSTRDEALLRRFYGSDWKAHTEELLTVFDYSDAYCQKRKEQFAGLSKEERLLRAIFEEMPEWRPNIAKAEAIIDAPVTFACAGPEFYKKLFNFVVLLRGIICNDETNPTDWHLEREELEVEDEGKQWFWRIKDKNGENVLEMAYPTLSRALVFLLIEWPHDIEPWLDFAGMYMYDGVNGKDLSEDKS